MSNESSNIHRTDVLGSGDPAAVEAALESVSRRAAKVAMTEAYRRWGWLSANVDPLASTAPPMLPDLDPNHFGFLPDDAEALVQTYCRTIGWEFGHVSDRRRRDWLAETAEKGVEPIDLAPAIDLVARAELFEAFCNKRMPTAKTFGLAGCEGFLVLIAEILNSAKHAAVEEVFVGGMHRGRLTQMALLFGKPLVQVLADAEGRPEYPLDYGASSDSPYHLGWQGLSAFDLPVWIAPHPSHLSIVGPVATGRARAARDRDVNALVMVLHTDAAFAGQGVNGEALQLSGLAPYETGGTIHLVLNNQLGFTTEPDAARTSRCCTDYAKLIDAPVLHVNAEDPVALIHAANVALAYRAAFGRDIVVEAIGYRRLGHNEIDEPRFTQPEMYRRIDAMPRLASRLAEKHGVTLDTAAYSAALAEAATRSRDWRPNVSPLPAGLKSDICRQMLAPIETGMKAGAIRDLGRRLTTLPETVVPHPPVSRFLDARRHAIETGEGLDWATAEALAVASLADAGHLVRFSGQDTVRGAFSQRHLKIHCSQSDKVHSVFDGIRRVPQVHDTPLIENAVLGFEYGYSLEQGDGLTVWEAQFGDFINVCQSVFDQFVVCGEDRWLAESNLVVLLPHGLDGGGPDHATAHPERLLSACARGNIQVVNPSTPANFFHMLRRQVLAPWRKPLVVLAPKLLLRHKGARSNIADFDGGARAVLSRSGQSDRIVMSTGKLSVLLEEAGCDATLLRLEQLYPFPEAELKRILVEYPDADLVWAQEEPENMGYFQWLDRKLETVAGRRWRLVSRPENPAASAGPKSWDDAHLKAVIDAALQS